MCFCTADQDILAVFLLKCCDDVFVLGTAEGPFVKELFCTGCFVNGRKAAAKSFGILLGDQHGDFEQVKAAGKHADAVFTRFLVEHSRNKFFLHVNDHALCFCGNDSHFYFSFSDDGISGNNLTQWNRKPGNVFDQKR